MRAELASEFHYGKILLDPNVLVIIISQRGETANSLVALWQVKGHGLKKFGIVNVVGSSIARETDNVLYILVGPGLPWLL